MRTGKDWSKDHVIRAVFGDKMVGDLISLSSAEQTFHAESVRLAVDKLGLKFEGLFSNPAKITSGMNLVYINRFHQHGIFTFNLRFT